ncbi:MAG: OmpH family outer membrane protein [Verrucomicrobiota bacterium]|jgi:Skp family chaperone for outer membrane proteins
MKNVLRIIFPAVLLMVFLSSPALAQNKSAATQTGKIGTVDMRKLFDGYWKTKQAEVALNDRKAELDKEDNGFIDDLKKARDEYQKLLDGANDQAISADERDKRKQAAANKYGQITDSETTIAQFERQAQATLAEQSQRMRANILNEIKAAVAAKAKAAGYAMVFDSASETVNQTPIILYGSGENDLTSAVLAQLNAGAPVDMARPAATTMPPVKIGTNNP